MHLVLSALIKILKNTHRHPANKALHYTGAPFYGTGIYMTIGYFVGVQTSLFLGIALWMSAVAMFVIGHKIEGNIMTMTPVLISRLLSRKFANYFSGKRIQLFQIWLGFALKH